MQRIDAVNFILPKLGERPVTDVNLPHPTVTIVLDVLENVTRGVLVQGWWFNQYHVKLIPDLSGNVLTGTDCMTFYPDIPGSVVQRGNKLINVEGWTDVFTEPVEGWVIQSVPFSELPESVAMYITWKTLIQVYVSDIGASSESQVWEQNAASAYASMHREHVKNRRYNTRSTAQWGRIHRSMHT